MTPTGKRQQKDQWRTQIKALRATQKVYYGPLFTFQNTALPLQTDTHTHTVIIVLAARWDNEEFSLAGVQVFSVQERRERGREKTPIKETQREAEENGSCRWRNDTSWSHRANISQQLTTLGGRPRAFSPGGIFLFFSFSCCCSPQQH